MRRRGQRGYTAVELMMAISVFGIGVAGIISMQKVTAVSNQHAKNLAIATHIAESWLDMLGSDAVAWNSPSASTSVTDINDTVWLRNVTANAGPTSWFLPAYNAGLNFGPAFDALGNPINNIAANLPNAQFCTHLRLSWLYGAPPATTVGLIRAEVRVFWLRDGQGSPVANKNPCDATVDPNAITGAVTKFHFVQKVTAIRENPL